MSKRSWVKIPCDPTLMSVGKRKQQSVLYSEFHFENNNNTYCVCKNTYTNMHICKFTCICGHTCTHTRSQTNMHTCVSYTHTRAHKRSQTNMHTHAWATRIHVHTNAHRRTCTHMREPHAYTCTQMLTHTHVRVRATARVIPPSFLPLPLWSWGRLLDAWRLLK